MTARTIDGTLVPIKRGWLCCPACGLDKLLRVEPNTRAAALPVFCKRCHREFKINIESQSQEPEPD